MLITARQAVDGIRAYKFPLSHFPACTRAAPIVSSTDDGACFYRGIPGKWRISSFSANRGRIAEQIKPGEARRDRWIHALIDAAPKRTTKLHFEYSCRIMFARRTILHTDRDFASKRCPARSFNFHRRAPRIRKLHRIRTLFLFAFTRSRVSLVAAASIGPCLPRQDRRFIRFVVLIIRAGIHVSVRCVITSKAPSGRYAFAFSAEKSSGNYSVIYEARPCTSSW